MAKRKKGKETSEESQKSDSAEETSIAQKKGLQKQDLWIAGGLFLIALLLRFHLLNAGLWYTDAVIAAQSAEATYNTGVLHYMHGVGYPGNVITITLLYALFKLVGNASSAEFATLFSSLFFASLTVGLIYLLVKKMLNSTFAAISASLVLNMLPVYLSTSTFGMSHQMAGFFIVLAFYLAMHASEYQDIKLKILASASLGWASAIRLESLQMLPLVLLFYWINRPPFSLSTKEGYIKFKLRQNRDDLIKDLACFIIPGLIMLLLPYTPMVKENGVKPLWDAFEYNRWLGFWVPGLTSMVIDWVSISMTTLGWILLFAGLIALFGRDKYIFLVVLVWCAYFFVLANTLTVEDRHTIPALIGFTLAIGFGLEWVYNRIHKIVGIAVLLLLLGMMFNTIYPILSYRSGFCGPKSFAYTLKDIVEKNSVVIAIDESPHLQYYGKLNTIGHPIDGDEAKIKENMDEIGGYLNNGTSVYLVSSAFAYDTPGGLSYNPDSGQLYDAKTKKIYNNLVYNPSSKSITDTTSGVNISLYGVWQVELFSNFVVTPIKTVENEDWHKKSVMFGKYGEAVFKISKRA